MIPALIGLAGGGVLARAVLWPVEQRLERRRLARLVAKVATLDADLHGHDPRSLP